MATNTDYLRWDAASMKQLIIDKLSESDVFTDQIFEDSNLTVLIEVFAYLYDVMTYQLNVGATESMFTDAQLYENLNRIVKMLGYNPRGFITSTAVCTMGTREALGSAGIYVIPKYTTLETALSDSNGDPIRYTFNDNYTFNANSTTTIDTDFRPIIYNGTWKVYPAAYTTLGIPFETVTLSELELDGDDKVYLSHTDIDVYVKETDGTYTKYTSTTNLYDSVGTDKKFEVRINENKQYTLKFGDNVNGKQLAEGKELLIIYLQSNGPDGIIGAGKIDTTITPSILIDGLSEEFIDTNILKFDDNPEYISITELEKLTFVNDEASSSVLDLEGVDDIRENAPVAFRTGNRLAIDTDYEQYVLTNYPRDVYDIIAMNNYSYMNVFHRWLDKYGKLTSDIRYYDYSFTDSCDFNNVYLWVKGFTNSNITTDRKRTMTDDINKIKILTSETIFVDPLLVTLTPYITGSYDLIDWDTNYENKIQVVRDRNTSIPVERIKQNCVTIIKKFFTLTNNSLGQTININDLYNSLMAVDGVKEVRTKYLANGSPDSTAQYYSGLSFALWTQHIIEGADFTKISGSFKLQDFQFPYLYDVNNIQNRIEVLADNYNINEVEY